MTHEFDSLPPIAKQTGIVTHIPTSGLPKPVQSHSESVEQIQEQMEKVIRSAKREYILKIVSQIFKRIRLKGDRLAFQALVSSMVWTRF